MIRYFLSFLFSFLFVSFASGQNLACFSDYMNRFFVFDNGKTTQLESLPVKFSQVGGNSVIYADNNDNFKAYCQGKTYDLLDFTPSSYAATDDLVVFFSNKILYVFDNGTLSTLPGWVSNYTAGDSIVGYFDVNSNAFKVYYQGSTEVLQDNIIDDNSLKSFKAGDNILAYNNSDGYFKAYYHRQIYDLGTNHVSSYQLGSSVVAYMDEYNIAFKVFYSGTVTTLENIAPKSFKAGDQQVAYVDNSGNFKIFYQGQVATISSIEPDFYSVDDNVIAYGTANIGFNVFYKGRIYPLESTTPASCQVDYNSVAYVDAYGYLKIFTDGQTTQASEIRISKFKLTKNVLMFKTTGLYDYHFTLNGQSY